MPDLGLGGSWAPGAVISDCGRYRYALGRSIPQPLRAFWQGYALFVMLNPSTADATTDDPTIRRCVRFAAREGFGQLAVANLYALRATNPRELWESDDPIGPENDEWITQLAGDASQVVVAWGAQPRAVSRANAVLGALDEITGGEVYCLGETRDGHPRHPLYVPANQPLVEHSLRRGTAMERYCSRCGERFSMGSQHRDFWLHIEESPRTQLALLPSADRGAPEPPVRRRRELHRCPARTRGRAHRGVRADIRHPPSRHRGVPLLAADTTLEIRNSQKWLA